LSSKVLSNHAVQLTPLARVWAGRDSPGKTLRPAGDQTIRNLHPFLATLTRPASGGSRTRIAWQLPLARVLHPSDACQRRS